MARTPQDPQIRIAEIIDVAENLFTTKGYRGTTISDIAKEMGVAQGMCYYYFKSKEEILEALLNRHASSLVSEIKDMACSESITPPEKIGLMLRIMLQGICFKDEVLLRVVYDEQNFHIKDQVARQARLALAPWGLKIIKEGCQSGHFSVSHPQTSLDFILIVMEFLIEAFYEKISGELLSLRLKMAESLIEKALGTTEGTINILL